MALLWDLLWLAFSILVIVVCLLLAWAVCYQLVTTDVPPGICQPLKIRALHIAASMGFAVEYMFRKMGLCKAFTIFRILIDGIPPVADSSLLIENVYFEDVRVRIYKTKRPSPEKRKGIVFFHGGHGIIGSIDAYERVCRHLAKESDAVVVSVGYRLAPEYQYPTQFRDCLRATTFFMETAENYGVDPAQIVISGDAFGGLLAAYVVQELVMRPHLPKPRAQILVAPLVQLLDFNLPSYQQNHFVPMVPSRVFLFFVSWYMAKSSTLLEFLQSDLVTPKEVTTKCQKWLRLDHIPTEIRGPVQEIPQIASPLHDVDVFLKDLCKTMIGPLLAGDDVFSRLPDTFILTCEFDFLRDDGLLYKRRLEDNGVRVSWCHLKDGFHGTFYFFRHWFLTFPCSREGVDNILKYVKSL